MYIHVESFMIQVDRIWDGPLRFRAIDSGQKLLEFIEANPVDPQSLLIAFDEAKSQYMNDLGFVRRNLDSTTDEWRGNSTGLKPPQSGVNLQRSKEKIKKIRWQKSTDQLLKLFYELQKFNLVFVEDVD